MADEPISDGLKAFILRHVDSIAQLEALLLLHKDQNATWNAGSLAGRLYVGERETLEILTRLAARGLAIEEGGAFKFNGRFEQLDMLNQLAFAYSRHLIPVTRLIHTKPSRIQEFADAFKLRRDK
jgi:hypothetical protein